MSEPAPELRPLEAPTIEGLDDLFVDVTEVQLHATATQLNATARSCTVKEASDWLGVPTSTIYRRIKAGKYPVVGNDENGAQIITVQLHATAPQLKTQLRAVAPQSNAVETQLHAVAAESGSDKSLTALIEMSKKLEAANYRIGWLESQLQERETEVKLLSDSQHNLGWWARFTKWCAGT
jgi:hypothetical protein